VKSPAVVYTDGGCSGNPGPGGWAYFIENDGNPITGSGGQKLTTNNQMEITAVLSALRYLASQGVMEAVVHTDSQYVQKGITTWVFSWERNGWKTADKKPVKNQELWQALREASKPMKIEWRWVKGHAGIPGNEACDQMVQEAIAAL